MCCARNKLSRAQPDLCGSVSDVIAQSYARPMIDCAHPTTDVYAEWSGRAGAKHWGWRTLVDVDDAQPLACKVYVGGVPFSADGTKVMAPDVARHVQAAMPTAFLAGVHLPSVRLLPCPWSYEPVRKIAEFCNHKLAVNWLVGCLLKANIQHLRAPCSLVDLTLQYCKAATNILALKHKC